MDCLKKNTTPVWRLKKQKRAREKLFFVDDLKKEKKINSKTLKRCNKNK